MILYLAGGFHFSNKIENETELGSHLINKYGKYNRLATYFYSKDAINIKTATENLDENKGSANSDSKGDASSRRKINRRSN